MARWSQWLVLFVLAHGAVAAPPAADPNAVAEVKAGRQKVAHATWWGFNAENATATLQAALDSGAAEVIVDHVGAPWIVDGLKCRSNQTVTFAKDVELQARKGQFKGTNDCLVAIYGVENVTLRGYGATFRMHRADYDDPQQYQRAEWRHSVSIKSSRNVKVLGLRLLESGGDGIYLGVSKAGVTNTDVLIKDVVCERHYRQGISVISAENLLIEDTVLKDTAGTAPMAGIDFEPNRPDEKLTNCVMRNCTVEHNSSYGIVMYLVPLTGKSAPVSLRFENCRTKGDRNGVGLVTTNGHADGDVKGTVEFVGCQIEQPENDGIMIGQKPADGIQVRFTDCTLIEPAMKKPDTAPVVFQGRHGNRLPMGGVEFRNLTIVDPLGRQPLALHDWAGGLGIERVTGNLQLRGKDGQAQTVEITPERLKAWMPQTAFLRFRDYPVKSLKPLVPQAEPKSFDLGSVRLRRSALWLLYAEKGQTVRCDVRYGQVGKYAGAPMLVRAVAPSGALAGSLNAAFGETTPLTFAAGETGVYRISAQPGGNWVALAKSSHPVCLTSAGEPIPFFAMTGELWFWVPAGVQEFGIKCFGDGTEGSKVALYNAAGTLVEEKDDITKPHQFAVKRPANAPGEAWRLVFSKGSKAFLEDFAVELQGLPPLLAPSRDGLLVPGE